jgi:hypothetical protein
MFGGWHNIIPYPPRIGPKVWEFVSLVNGANLDLLSVRLSSLHSPLPLVHSPLSLLTRSQDHEVEERRS